MKHCLMELAGYKHLSCDKVTHIHRLLNLETKEVELWILAPPGACGIRYKNSYLTFLDFETELLRGIFNERRTYKH